MDIIEGIELLKRDGTLVNASEILTDKEIICFYFASSWCAPCKGFTPLLRKIYEQLTEEGRKIVIIYVSADQDETKFNNYFRDKHGDWFAVPFKHDAVKQLRQRFRIKGVPVLVVSRPDGTIITEEGRVEVQNKGKACYDDWCKD